MRNPSTSISPPSATPRQLSMTLDSLPLQRMNASERATALAQLVHLLMLAAGVATEERDNDNR